MHFDRKENKFEVQSFSYQSGTPFRNPSYLEPFKHDYVSPETVLSQCMCPSWKTYALGVEIKGIAKKIKSWFQILLDILNT